MVAAKEHLHLVFAPLVNEPLQELANVEMALGVNQVNRENGKRRVVVTANASNSKPIIKTNVTGTTMLNLCEADCSF